MMIDRVLAALALALMLLLFAPLLPGLAWALAPAAALDTWRLLWADPQWPQALTVTLISATLSTALAWWLADSMAQVLYPSPRWQALQQRLPWLLATPHTAWALGWLFLLAPSGWLMRLPAQWLGWDSPPLLAWTQDRWGLSMAVALACKECWFLLWMMQATLAGQRYPAQSLIAQSLGYRPAQSWRMVIRPQLRGPLFWPLAAVLAYGLSVVDVALILGPNHPPSLAVLTWQWLHDADALKQAQGAAACVVLLGLFALLLILWQCLRRLLRGPPPDGVREGAQALTLRLMRFNPAPALLTLSALLLALMLLWSVAERWFFPALFPSTWHLAGWADFSWWRVWTSGWLALGSALIALPLALLWLEWGRPRWNLLFFALLVMPALPLVAAQYRVVLPLGLDGTVTGLLWSHLVWVLPYQLVLLAGAYQRFDARLLLTAQTLGKPRWQACLRVKWPLLLSPLLASVAVGFSVSMALYLPTLHVGAGRFETMTTEAVALAAGGNRHAAAVHALWQLGLPLIGFALATWLPRWWWRPGQAMR